MASPPPAKKQRTDSPLQRLELALSKYYEDFQQKNIKLSQLDSEITTVEHVKQAKKILEEHGFIIIRNSISIESLKEAKINIGSSINDMWHEFLSDKPDIRKRLNKGDLDCFQQYRNSSSGQGNASFGYYYKQFLPTEDYPKMMVEGEEISFDHNSVYGNVNLPLLMHSDNIHSLAIMLSLTHVHGAISWDSVKYSTNPRPKPKTMTKQTITPMHIDHYGNELERYQAIDNDDQQIKLFFVPGSHSKEVHKLLEEISGKNIFESHGYKQIKGISNELNDILWRYAIAPPPRGRIIWKSGTIHFEGVAKNKPEPSGNPFEGCYRCQGIQEVPNARRFRFVIGPHQPLNLSQKSMKRLAIAAERGLCPAVYSGINGNTQVGKNIVNRKTTQYKVPRSFTEEEKTKLHSKLTDIPSEDNSDEELNTLLNKVIPSKMKRLLYGVHEEIDETVGFSIEDTKILNTFKDKTK